MEHQQEFIKVTQVSSSVTKPFPCNPGSSVGMQASVLPSFAPVLIFLPPKFSGGTFLNFPFISTFAGNTFLYGSLL